MLEPSDYEDLPEDPSAAFVHLETKARERLTELIRTSGDNFNYDQELRREYMNRVLAAASVYKVNLSFDDLNTISTATYDEYMKFIHEIDRYSTIFHIENSRRNRKYSVALDASTKARLHHHLNQMKDVVRDLDISEVRREAFYSCIADLEAEINRNRSRMEAIGSALVSYCQYVGEGAENLNPLVKILERVAAALGKAKETEIETDRRLPAPKIPKRIEHRKKPIDTDEIPF